MEIYQKSPFSGKVFSPVLIWIAIFFLTCFLIPEPKVSAEADFSLGEKLIFSQGNSLLAKINPNGPEPKVVKRFTVITTAYSSTVWETDNDPFITAAGTWVRDGIVANNLLPLGTKIRLPELYGDKIFIVEDRMNWKKGNYHIDIWFSSYWEAKNFGAQRTYIEVLES